MEIINVANLTFTYNKAQNPVLKDISFSVNEGEFLLIIGESGCGKTTLIRMLKKELIPYGKREGDVLFNGTSIDELSSRESAASIGFIMQDPDSQIVTDRVYSELAFGLESLGYNSGTIRSRVSEFASYFGFSESFEKKTNSLSGGQKQLLNLASVICMNPKVIILDEPTSMLDPISAMEFINTLKRINDDFGTTVIIVEHHLQEIFSVADKVMYMENGSVFPAKCPKEICKLLKGKRIEYTLPVSARVFSALNKIENIPLTVREGKKELKKLDISNNYSFIRQPIPSDKIISCRKLFFRYDKKSKDVLKGCSLSVNRGEIYSVVGDNGSGKSTLLKLLSGIIRPYSGKISISERASYLPQNPKDIFVREKLREDFTAIDNSFMELCERFEITHLLDMHPYDLSGGELQRAAICKLMLGNPKILLLDEPTKGLDSFAKKSLGEFIKSLAKNGTTIVVVTHDLEFAAEYSDTCGLLFDGEITSEDDSNSFFSKNIFYTTAAARMSKGILEQAVTAEQIIKAYS